MSTILTTILHFISNIHIQFGTITIPTGMKISFSHFVFIAFLFSTLIAVPVSLGITPVYAQEPPPPIAPDNNQGLPPGPPPRFPLPFDQQLPFGQASNFSFGPIGSIQNDESGQPAWVVVGFWRGNLLSFNETSATAATATTMENSEGDNNTSSQIAPAVFNANLRMIMLNGSAPHTHVITNFVLSDVSSNENGTMTYTGNSTVSMPETPFVDVPTTIKVSGEIISIFPEPSAVDQHFGNTPIYGVILPEEGRRGGQYNDGPPSSP